MNAITIAASGTRTAPSTMTHFRRCTTWRYSRSDGASCVAASPSMLLPLWPELGLRSNPLSPYEPSNDGSAAQSRRSSRWSRLVRPHGWAAYNPAVATPEQPLGATGTEQWRESSDAPRERHGELFSTMSGAENEP